MTDTDSLNKVHFEFFTAHFPDGQVKSFNQAKQGQTPRFLNYVPDEAVMERLDAALGPGRWSFTAEVAAPNVAKVTLGILWPDTGWVYYSDFGYPTNGDRGEALKEAVSDGIRRVCRFVGIARYIYAGEIDPRPASTPPPATAQSGAGGHPDFDMAEVDRAASDSQCAKHGVSWMGSPYTPGADRSGRYHKDGVWDDSGKTKWCRHPADEAAKKAARG